MKVPVPVTAQDIRSGIPRRFTDCPVALAVLRQIELGNIPGNPAGLAVGSEIVVLDKHLPGIPLPASAIDFIDRIDHRKPAEPFTFELEI